MAKLTVDQIAGYAKSAGFSGDNVRVAVAVALAESGGDPRSHNPVPPDDSYGLWQINMLGSLGPDRRKRFGLSSNTDLYDPATNARVAYGIYKGSGWNAWTTYTRGTYKKYLTGSYAESDDTSSSGSSDAASTPEDGGLFGIGSALNSFGETFMKGIASVGAVLIAVVLLVLGIVILMRSQVTSVIPGGKLAKVAKVAKGVSS